MQNITFVTALYDIQRETRGDGRKWNEYLEWFKDTLALPFPMVVYIGDEKLIEFVNNYRNVEFSTKIIFQSLHDVPYAYYENTFERILTSSNYKNKIKDPNRVECKIPFYNIIIYSKFKWLENVANTNPFNSDFFFWVDAGISRFIPLSLYGKVKKSIQLPPNKLIIQNNYTLYHYPVNNQYLWDSQCLICTTMFGGDKKIIIDIAANIDYELKQNVPLDWINNEQILIAYIYNKKPQLFSLFVNNTNNHLSLFEKIFI